MQHDVSGGGGPAVTGGEGDGGVSEKIKIRGKGHNPVHEMYDIVTRLR